MKKSTFGIIVTTRGFFNPKLAERGRKKILEKLNKMGLEYVVLGEEDTPFGVVETLEDAKKCAKLFNDNREKIDGIIVSLPNFGDEVGTVTALSLAEIDVPVLVQACDDTIGEMDIVHRRDSFCGKLSVCNNLYQYGIKFTNTTLHTCSMDSEEFTKDIEFFDRVCRVVNGLKGARIAQIGTRPAAFKTVRYSEKLLEDSKITVVPVDMSEIIFAAKDMENNEDVAKKVEEIKAYGIIPSTIKEENINKAAKLCLVIEKWMRDNDCVAGAMQCWDSIQKNYGCAACLQMSMLGEAGIPIACETDLTGAVTMYALQLASGQPSGYLDWNNNYNDDRDKCVAIHCSNYPKSFMNNTFEISNLDILGKSLGEERCFGALKGQVAPGPMTYAKISTDDRAGKIKVYIGEGSFTDDPIETIGGPAICHIPNLQGLMKYLCKNGFEHHVAMNRTHTAEILEEALGKYMGWEVYKHI